MKELTFYKETFPSIGVASAGDGFCFMVEHPYIFNKVQLIDAKLDEIIQRLDGIEKILSEKKYEDVDRG